MGPLTALPAQRRDLSWRMADTEASLPGLQLDARAARLALETALVAGARIARMECDERLSDATDRLAG